MPALATRFGGVRIGPRLGSLDRIGLNRDDEGWHLAYGDMDGRFYLCDESKDLSAGPDDVVWLSAVLDTLVIGCGADKIAGDRWFYAAAGGDLARGYRHNFADMLEPWSAGDPIASEAERPFEDFDGLGVTTALYPFGFPYALWESGHVLRELIYQPGASPGRHPRPLAEEIERFREGVRPEDGDVREPTLIRGFDLVMVPRARRPAAGLPAELAPEGMELEGRRSTREPATPWWERR